MERDRISLFVTCASELEPLLLEELAELGINQTELGYRGVYVDQWDWSTIYKINYASRLASRVLLPLHRFKCFHPKSLYLGANDIEWSRYLNRGQTFAIDANVSHPQLRNSLFAAQVVKDAICDQLREKRGSRPSVDTENPDVQINLFIQHNVATISLDTSGAPLHKRGYRIESVEAPMQESLAAAVLRLAKYAPGEVLFDPCCGSGTLLIEAALIASKTPPGFLRHKWGFMNHPDFSQQEWLRVRNELDKHRCTLHAGKFFGMDVNKNCARISKVNSRAAGFGQEIEIMQGDFRDFTPAVPPTLIVVNPPHGNRLEDEASLVPLYRSLGDFFKQKAAKPGRGFVFTGSMELAKEIGLSAKRRYVLKSGGIDCRLLEFDLY